MSPPRVYLPVHPAPKPLGQPSALRWSRCSLIARWKITISNPARKTTPPNTSPSSRESGWINRANGLNLIPIVAPRIQDGVPRNDSRYPAIFFNQHGGTRTQLARDHIYIVLAVARGEASVHQV